MPALPNEVPIKSWNDRVGWCCSHIAVTENVADEIGRSESFNKDTILEDEDPGGGLFLFQRNRPLDVTNLEEHSPSKRQECPLGLERYIQI